MSGRWTSPPALFLVLLVAGCAGTGDATSRPGQGAATSPSNSSTRAASSTRTYPPPDGNVLYAVLEPQPTTSGPGQNATVAIAGLDGYARAKALFTPRGSVYVPDAAVPRMPEAHVLGGAVYFVDGAGVVRKLQPSGANQVVATFPLAPSQQEISFAVSPDGSKIIAAVLTLPAVGPVPSPGGAPWPALIGQWKLEIELAASGGATRTLHQWTSTDYPNQPGGFSNIMILNWDSRGPIAVVGSNVATQNAAFGGQQLFGGHFARIDTVNGLPGAQIGTCLGDFTGPWSASADGATICADDNGGRTVIAVTVPGKEDWFIRIPSSQLASPVGDFVLAADGNRLAMDGQVIERDGSGLPLPNKFQPEGWLDAQTLIGYEILPAGEYTMRRMFYVWLQNPTRAIDLGFAGQFVGVV